MTTDTKALRERLRQAAMSADSGYAIDAELVDDAADAIDRLEAERDAALAALRELIGILEVASVMPDAINKHMLIAWDDPALQRARAIAQGEGKP